MLRHKRSTHSESDSEYGEVSEPSGDIFGAESDDMSDSTSEDTAKIDPWQEVVEEAFTKCRAQFQTNVDKVMKEDADISESEAEKNVFKDMKKVYRKALMNAFGNRIVWFDGMKKDPTYKAIKKSVNHLVSKEDYEPLEALKYGIHKRKFLFDKVLDAFAKPRLNDDDMEDEREDSESD